MWANRLKTVVLLTTLSALLILLGGILGGRSGIQFALLLSIGINFFTYFFSEKIVLSLYNAIPIDRKEYAYIYNIIDNLARKMNIPAPKLWIINSPMANAFATGRNPANSSVVITSGILNILNEEELRGVLAHELSHIKNRDVLIATIAATIATAIGYIARIAQYSMFLSNNNKEKNILRPIATIIIAILMPIAALLIQLAISRSREYLADESGAKYSNDPMALASALEKLHNHIRYSHMDNNDTLRASSASLFIVLPFNIRNWTALFATHPPINKRIERLKNLAKKKIQIYNNF